MSKRQRLLRKFHDRQYRNVYRDTFVDACIATQIRALRGDMTQATLARLARMDQSRISTMENVNYSKWTVNTLKRLAAAFDLWLVVRFEEYGVGLRDAESFDAKALARRPFDKDPVFMQSESGGSQGEYIADQNTMGLGLSSEAGNSTKGQEISLTDRTVVMPPQHTLTQSAIEAATI